jgi:antitoxin YefM
MNTMSLSSFKDQLTHTLDKVNDDHNPILITREKGEPAVVMSYAEFKSYQETAYLMSSPKNAERLNRSIAQAEAGLTTEQL